MSDESEEALIAALQAYFEDNRPDGASFRSGWEAGRDCERIRQAAIRTAEKMTRDERC